MNVNPKPQLFLIHFAGGNCYSFAFLKKYLEQHVEMISLELPGRGKRMRESLIRNKSQAIEDVFQQVKNQRNPSVPYVLYGHSMGAALGIYIAGLMEAYGDPSLSFIASGNAGPGESKEKNLYSLAESEFKTELKKLGGVPKELFENEELYQFFEPILRADFEVVEKADTLEVSALTTTPILALMGTQEENSDRINNWEQYTRASFSGHLFEGDHFFIHQHPDELANHILKSYDRSLVL